MTEKKRGRKPVQIDMGILKALKNQGLKPGQIAKALGVSRFLVRDRLEKMETP